MYIIKFVIYCTNRMGHFYGVFLFPFSITLFYTLKMQVEPRGNCFTPRTQQEVTHCVINSISPPTHCTSVLKREFSCFRCQTQASRTWLSLISAQHATACQWSRVPNQAAVRHTNTPALSQKFAGIWSSCFFCFRKGLQVHICWKGCVLNGAYHTFFIMQFFSLYL